MEFGTGPVQIGGQEIENEESIVLNIYRWTEEILQVEKCVKGFKNCFSRILIVF